MEFFRYPVGASADCLSKQHNQGHEHCPVAAVPLKGFIRQLPFRRTRQPQEWFVKVDERVDFLAGRLWGNSANRAEAHNIKQGQGNDQCRPAAQSPAHHE